MVFVITRYTLRISDYLYNIDHVFIGACNKKNYHIINN